MYIKRQTDTQKKTGRHTDKQTQRQGDIDIGISINIPIQRQMQTDGDTDKQRHKHRPTDQRLAEMQKNDKAVHVNIILRIMILIYIGNQRLFQKTANC